MPLMNRRDRGFTLLELMMVLVIAGLLIGLGVPAMGNFLRNSRMTAAANDALAAMHLARTEAIKRRVRVSICTSNNPTDAAPACADSPNLTGWFVWVDDNGDAIADATDGDGVPDPGEPVLLRHDPVPATISAVSDRDPLRLTYLDTGFTQGGTTQIVMCDSRGNVPSAGELSAARGLFVSVTGRPAVTRDRAEIEALGGCP